MPIAKHLKDDKMQINVLIGFLNYSDVRQQKQLTIAILCIE